MDGLGDDLLYVGDDVPYVEDVDLLRPPVPAGDLVEPAGGYRAGSGTLLVGSKRERQVKGLSENRK